jgi:hypothetical protein
MVPPKSVAEIKLREVDRFKQISAILQENKITVNNGLKNHDGVRPNIF